jgi:glycosyltransferase involved in cell wall biosynthesis
MNILTVAAITKRKRINLCRDTCREMERRGYDVHWRIIGSGPLKRIWQRGASSSMEWIDRVEAVAPQYQWADVFVLPSLDEGLGMVYAESVIHGTPFVCMSGQGGDEVIRLSGGAGISIDDSWSYPVIVNRLVGAIDYASCLRVGEANVARMKEVFSLDRIRKEWEVIL